MTSIEQNTRMRARSIDQNLLWLQTIINQRIKNLISRDTTEQAIEMNPPALDLSEAGDFYAKFSQEYDLTPEERLVVILALAPEVRPELLDSLLIRQDGVERPYTQVGGITICSFNGFIPTLKTALFLLGGPGVSEQLQFMPLVDSSEKLYSRNILREVRGEEGSPAFHRQLALSESALSQILSGEDVRHEYNADFPARLLNTMMEWDDLVLAESTAIQLKELLTWPEHGHKLIKDLQMAKNIQPGYRALFYGPAGTGKTLTAALVGKRFGKPVYRIDLSQLVSKYIGETEKNLEKIFSAAENRDWVLFFDEADSLFGKRTSIGTANDRFANQETAFLLQRIETCNNVVILATNLKSNLDEAFTRRFQSIVHFPVPGETERLCLWQGAFSKRIMLEKAIDLKEVAKKYDISGGSIINVVRYATLMAVAGGAGMITYSDLMDGIKREYAKLGRTV
jgi:hypothetical protein